jgi:hypothetical protein
VDELKVPKRRAEAQLTLVGGAVRSVGVFLAEFASTHDGPERVSDVLNAPGDFIPAVDLATGRTFLVNRVSIVTADVSEVSERQGAEQHTIPNEHEVEVTFSDGRTLRGLLSYVMPPERSRPIDYLHEQPPFFRLLCGERLFLVNKLHATQLEILGG